MKYERLIKSDTLKKEYCDKNNIKLIEIPYCDYENLNETYLMEAIYGTYN